MAWTTLISPEALARQLKQPEWRIFDCRFDLGDPSAGRQAWALGHIPGAIHADLERVLSGAVSASSGRHPLPAVDELTAWLAGCGVDEASQVVCYDADHGAFAARLWWLLRWLGHRSVAVLDGGFAGWSARGYPITQEPERAPTQGAGPARQASLAPTVEAPSLLEDTGWLVVDARASARFDGEHEPIDPVAGHVPGALNRPFTRNLDVSGLWRAPDALREQWTQLLGSTDPRDVVHMCGSGVTAAHNVLAMEHAGLTGSKLYPGSWSHWITDPSRPIERRAAQAHPDRQ